MFFPVRLFCVDANRSFCCYCWHPAVPLVLLSHLTQCQCDMYLLLFTPHSGGCANRLFQRLKIRQVMEQTFYKGITLACYDQAYSALMHFELNIKVILTSWKPWGRYFVFIGVSS